MTSYGQHTPRGPFPAPWRVFVMGQATVAG
jgi:hypothetical protein